MRGVINYPDGASLSLAAPETIEDLDLTTADIGLMGTVRDQVDPAHLY